MQGYWKLLSMSMVCQKEITSSIQIIQILTKRSAKRKRYFIVKVHLSKMKLVASHFKFKNTVSIAWQANKNKKEALCTLSIISCRMHLTNKLNRDPQNLIQRKSYSRGDIYNNKWNKHLKKNFLFKNNLLFIFILNSLKIWS